MQHSRRLTNRMDLRGLTPLPIEIVRSKRLLDELGNIRSIGLDVHRCNNLLAEEKMVPS
jgi:hypothetical protein